MQSTGKQREAPALTWWQMARTALAGLAGL